MEKGVGEMLFVKHPSWIFQPTSNSMFKALRSPAEKVSGGLYLVQHPLRDTSVTWQLVTFPEAHGLTLWDALSRKQRPPKWA